MRVMSGSCCQLGPGLAGTHGVIETGGKHRQGTEQYSRWIGVAHEDTVTPQSGQPGLDPALVKCRVLLQPGSRHVKGCFTPLASGLTLCWAVDQRPTKDAFGSSGEAFVRPSEEALVEHGEVDSARVRGENLAQQAPQRVTLTPIELIDHDRAPSL